MPQLTEHARKRCNAREIPEADIDLVMRYGRRSWKWDDEGPVCTYTMPDNTRIRAIPELDQLRGLNVITTRSGQVITAYHLNKRLKRRARRLANYSESLKS